MNTYRQLIGRLSVAIAVVLALGVSASASASAAPPAVQISNFGQVDDQYYRGAQPDGRDYGDLAALGVKTVIDLTRGGRDNERGMVEQAGMTFYRIPLTTSETPSKAYSEMKQHKFETFLTHPELRHFVHDFYLRAGAVLSAANTEVGR